MKSALSFALALTILAWSGEGQAKIIDTELSPPHTIAVHDLIGLTPAQVQRRLTGLDVDWPRTVGLEVAAGPDLLSFSAIDEDLSDAAAAERWARWRTYAERLPKVWSSCSVSAEPDRRGPLLLMFRNDRLEQVWERESAGPDTTFRPAADGALPLADGAAFLARWGRRSVDEATRLTVRCVRRESVAAGPADRQAKRGRLSASDMQGLALAPFAVGLPVMNGERGAQQRAGAALYAQLAPGYRLPDPPTRFASEHGGVRAIRGDPGYVVLKVDLGGYPSRNLSNRKDFALIGVRDGVVAWRSLEYSLASPHLPPTVRH
jgi:hypothetical protein